MLTTLLLVIVALSYLSFGKREVTSSIQLDHQTESNQAAANRIASLENQLSELSSEVNLLTKLVKQNSLRSDNSSELSSEVNLLTKLVKQNSLRSDNSMEEIDDLESYEVDVEVEADSRTDSDGIDPMSAEGIALENESQNNYIRQVDDIYSYEELDPEWAQAIESDVLSKLTDIDSFATGRNSDSDSDGTVPDIVVTSFECRSQLCGTEIISGSEDEMIAYQHYMVAQTKQSLPSIVFSPIEAYGNKFKMKAYLARDEYEFPVPRNQ